MKSGIAFVKRFAGSKGVEKGGVHQGEGDFAQRVVDGIITMK
ncbi:MAG: hypothetical protein ACQKBT_01835 [Puniceicoccales bacterium]